MELATAVQTLSFTKNPRRGQQKVFDALEYHPHLLNVQLPTGYGKTFAAAGSYAIKKEREEVDRNLIIVPTTAQLDQFVNDGPAEFAAAGVKLGKAGVVDVSFFGIETLKRYRNEQVFVITIQALINNMGMSIIRELLGNPRHKWQLTVDEHHHYAFDKVWGPTVKNLQHAFLLAMSATPSRPGNDNAFGAPNVTVSYREGVEEGVLKPLKGHSYEYRIEVIGKDQKIRYYSTSELIKDAGSNNPEDIERFLIDRKMRWNPDYISPLLSYPIDRMLNESARTGYKLQALVGAMCVSHAELVCDQLRMMYPNELSVNWVGTGPNGRQNPEENKRIIKQFCPEKDENGERHPTLRVLVQVGMAGEGLDSIYVSEVCHLNTASKNNSNDQENGRAARSLRDSEGKPIVANINFDSSSDYARLGYVGDLMMDAMDNIKPTNLEIEQAKQNEEDEEKERKEWQDLQETTEPKIVKMELENINSGHPDVQTLKPIAVKIIRDEAGFPRFTEADIYDSESPNHTLLNDYVLDMLRKARHQEGQKVNERSLTAQWHDQVNNELNKLTRNITNHLEATGKPVSPKRVGEIKTNINIQKKKMCGSSIAQNLDVLKKHHSALVALDQSIKSEIKSTGRLPKWVLKQNGGNRNGHGY